MRRIKWCNGHESWVMGHERWPISISVWPIWSSVGWRLIDTPVLITVKTWQPWFYCLHKFYVLTNTVLLVNSELHSRVGELAASFDRMRKTAEQCRIVSYLYCARHHSALDAIWRIQEAQLLLGDRATRMHAKDSWNGRGNDNLGWMTFKCTSRSSKVAPIES